MPPSAVEQAEIAEPVGPGVAPRRPKTTRRSVIIADRAADWTIRIGGIMVILAVFGIMVFLAEVAVPLFLGGSVLDQRSLTIEASRGTTLMDRLDEYKTVAVAVTDAGEVTASHVGTGQTIATPDFDFGGVAVTSFARTLSGNDVAFGFADGTVRFGALSVDVGILPGAAAPANLRALDGRDRTDGSAVYSAVAGGQLRKVAISLSLEDPQQIADEAGGSAIVALDYRLGGTAERQTRSFVTVDAGGVARLSLAESKVNLLTKKTTTNVRTSTLPPLPAGFEVADILITEKADQVLIAERGGTVYRFDTRKFDNPVLAETIDLLPGDATLTVFGFLIGEQSVVVGDSVGGVDVYFRLPRRDAGTADGYTLVRSHQLEPHGSAVVAMSASQRTKSFVTADAEGNVWVRHSTSEQVLLRLAAEEKSDRIETLVLAPRDDGVLAVSHDGKAYFWDITIPHPETTWSSIFGKVWYEGYPEPVYTWQSSSGEDSFEPKLSLIPLIFGTIKGTFYSLLFAVPVALLAAIYTSEFVHHRVRSVVKPVMEMMASLPSVVLGFIAALILAPIVETWIAAVLLAFVVLPLSLLAAAYAWQMLPYELSLRLQGIPKFAMMFVMIGVGVLLAYALGPAFESLFFAGDVKAWANGNVGSGVPFMFLLLFPGAFLAAMWGVNRVLGDALQERLRVLPRLQAALLDLGRWLALLAVAALLAYVVAAILGGIGYDPRGGIVDTYVQRNTLIVGFAMGFAVIPIIYTIAEDALNAVPEHLRAASLACGATPWQTATTVILPTALSGVFAAIMVGMGRAVGETMIVVMAAGNTPILEWNVFNGLRALSANIAVELPEAVKDGTLYRMLFLAAFTLFVMTFVINTGAEVIRQRFRKRAAQL
jgi:phosphate transport system permease protein